MKFTIECDSGIKSLNIVFGDSDSDPVVTQVHNKVKPNPTFTRSESVKVSTKVAEKVDIPEISDRPPLVETGFGNEVL